MITSKYTDDRLDKTNKRLCLCLCLQQLNDMGHYAEALMTKGVLAPRGSMEQLKVTLVNGTIHIHCKS